MALAIKRSDKLSISEDEDTELNVPDITDSIQLGGNGVKSILAKYTPEKAIAEYVWNGFDAGATLVSIDFESANDLGALLSITVEDNGNGIPREMLQRKFKPFHESEKANDNKDSKHHSLVHGKNGVGRLTFFTFANKAVWSTRYQDGDTYREYEIEIQSNNLENYTGHNSPLRASSKASSSTVVTFDGIRELTESQLRNTITNYLRQEFGWFLELFKTKGFAIKIDGEYLDYASTHISDREGTKFVHKESGTVFEISYIRWRYSLQSEYSKFYLIDSNDNEVWKDTTKLNNKGDHFYHSVYVRSAYFDNFHYDAKQTDSEQTLASDEVRPFNSKNDPEYKFLEDEITEFLRRKRKPFLREASEQLVDQYEKEGILPDLNSEWELVRREELKSVVKGLYRLQPKIFSASSTEQKKTFVHLLNALLDSDERDQLLQIIGAVVKLDSQEREDLINLLKSTELSGVIRTIRLIANRYTIVDALKELIYNTSLNANERDHLQKMIDENYWIFGEQYHLLTSTEAKFDKALRAYTHFLTVKAKPSSVDHADKNKEMDIFLCRQNKLNDTIENVVVELKSPTVALGEKEVSQVKKYMSVILSKDEFNGDNTTWEFILVGNKFNTSGFIEGELESASNHGERNKGLIFKSGRYKIYARKWSDVFTDFECRHKFLEEKLELKRDELTREYSSAAGIIEEHTSQSSKAAH